MIVIGIVLFLLKIMVPQYTKYFARLRQTEVSINLSALHAAQVAYHVEHGHYTTNLAALKWQPNGYHADRAQSSSFYTYGFSEPSQEAAITFFSGTSQTPQSLLGKTFASANAFTAAAVAQHDDGIERWVISQDGVVTKES